MSTTVSVTPHKLQVRSVWLIGEEQGTEI